MADASQVLMVAAGLAAVLSLAFRYRRARTAERAQLKWLLYAGALVVAAALIAAGLVEQIMGPGNATNNLQNAMVSGAIALVAVAIGIAVCYRLYDIDRIISRTVAYAIITSLLVGVYAGLVLLTTQVFRFHTPVAVAASTLAAAALFNPVRRRVQQMVDRRFNRARYDADQTIAAFAARLKDAVTWTLRVTCRCRAPGPGTRPRIGVDQPRVEPGSRRRRHPVARHHQQVEEGLPLTSLIRR